ncbi:acetate/propionate family kinase [Candidatus Magnetomonas plexicatena]|uniref:acetate/propionate family kinase n=1 Tax=Candidatus Magnetomonas plexicatena TaxID=2552947 RepID=UPI001C7871F8|nr:acetate/propionate family kinase [Nitrospirales bacterium LBB_01]
MNLNKFLSQVKQFEELSDEELRVISEAASVVDYSDGMYIKRVGEMSRFFYVVYDGKVRVALESGDTITMFTRGDIFGEMSLMTGEPSGADIVSEGSSQVVKLPRELVSHIISGNPAAMTKIAKTIAHRLIKRDSSENEKSSIRNAKTKSNDPYDLDFSSAIDPIKILVINSRANSLKFSLFDTRYSVAAMDGIVDKIGTSLSFYKGSGSRGDFEGDVLVGSMEEAIKLVVTLLTDAKGGVIGKIEEITAVGHRVVHGGNKFYNSIVIDKSVIENIKEFNVFAPFHNPHNLEGIECLMRLLPNASHVAVFDTAFHKGIPEHARRYALTPSLNTDDRIRRYGFHGVNHHYVTLKAAEYLKKTTGQLKVISCHLGHGSSITAIDHGRSIDTSMGMTPLEGLVMGSRSGDVDPGLLLYLMTLGYTADDLNKMLNEQSGIKGVSEVSSYMEEVLAAAEDGNRKAETAVSMFCYKVKKYIGSYIAALGGLDVLVFTGGIGSNSTEVRARICQGLDPFGITLDDNANRQVRPFLRQVEEISEANSKVKTLVIQADEKRMIARETLHALGRHTTVSSRQQEYKQTPIPVNVSAHHVHVTPEAFKVLFGEGKQLTEKAPLSQPGQYAANETVNLIGPKGRVEKVRILGPYRKDCQVEISRTEEFKLGIDAPVRDSGDIEGTPGITLEGTVGQLKLEKGLICARRHVHMSPEDALKFGLRDRDVVLIKIKSKRELTFGDVLVRVHPDFRLDMHIDTDEGNAVEHEAGMVGFIEGIQHRAYM